MSESNDGGRGNQNAEEESWLELYFSTLSVATDATIDFEELHFDFFGLAPPPTENQPEGAPAAPAVYQPEAALFSASDTPVPHQPDSALLPASAASAAAAAAPVPGPAGGGFTPHTIIVGAGEDVLARLIFLPQVRTEAVCILSATGTIFSPTLRQGLSSTITVTYEGTFDIMSLSGSFLLSETGGRRSRTGGLRVTLSGPDGCTLGGAVAGPLQAHSPVQIVVGTFFARDQQQVTD